MTQRRTGEARRLRPSIFRRLKVRCELRGAHCTTVLNVTDALGAVTSQFFARIVTVWEPGIVNGSETESPRTSVLDVWNASVGLVVRVLRTWRVTIQVLSGAATPVGCVSESQRITMFVGELVPEPNTIVCPPAGCRMFGALMFGWERQVIPLGRVR